MDTSTTTRSRILVASVRLLSDSGLRGWNTDELARRAGCAKGLVNYHFNSKLELLGESALSLGANRRHLRLDALRKPTSSDALDHLWAALVDDVESGRFGAYVALMADGFDCGGPDSSPSLQEAAANAFEVPITSLPAELSIDAMLDGLELQLLKGAKPEAVRDAYHRLWLGLIET